MELASPIDFVKNAVAAAQDYSVLAWRSLANLFGHPRYLTDTLQQADLIGVGSLPIVVLTGFSPERCWPCRPRARSAGSARYR